MTKWSRWKSSVIIKPAPNGEFKRIHSLPCLLFINVYSVYILKNNWGVNTISQKAPCKSYLTSRKWAGSLTERGVSLVKGWSRSPRFRCTIRCDLSRFVTIWCDDYDCKWIVLIVEIFWTVQNLSTINTIATTDLKIWWDLTGSPRLLHDY